MFAYTGEEVAHLNRLLEELTWMRPKYQDKMPGEEYDPGYWRFQAELAESEGGVEAAADMYEHADALQSGFETGETL